MSSLLDMIGSAEGQPSANYLKGGRTVLKISRVSFRDPTPKLPRASFRIDGEILKSTNAKHQEQAGMSGTMNLNFKFADQDLAKTRRALRAALASKEGREVTEAEAAEQSKTLCGEKQPLVGAVVTVVAVEDPQKGDPTKTFTKYEVEVPTERDLDGLFED
jgi:hypothetical protein